MDKPVIETNKVKSILITIQYVFRANFNDTYLLEELVINLSELDKEKLIWFDPYNGRSKMNQTEVSIKYVSDDEFVILEKKENNIVEHKIKKLSEHIICEDYDQSLLLAAHIRLW